MKTSEKIQDRDTKHGERMNKKECKCKGDCPCCDKKENEEKSNLKAKALALVSMLTLFGPSVFAQDAAQPAGFWDDPINSPMLPFYIVMAFIAVTIVLVVLVLIYLVKVLNFVVHRAEEERAQRLGLPVKKRQSWWSKFWDDMNAAVPVGSEQDIDLGHNYDGIHELDNHLPPWWTGLFYFTIIWGVAYLIAYHVTLSLPLSGDEYANEQKVADEKKRAFLASRPAVVIDENTLVYTADAAILAKGKSVFVGNNCRSCHAEDGGGNGIGPNLTDEYWLHGGSIKDIFTTINKGVVEKGMPAWGKAMSAEDVRDVTFYVMSLQGTKPANPKAPQGELYRPEPVAAPADSTKAASAMNN